MALTKLENMINPEVLADMVSANLPNAIRFAPLAVVNTDLVGVAGDTLQFPAYVYSGDAKDVGEGVAITTDLLTATTKPVTVKKVGKGIELSDESVLSGYGDPVDEAGKQLVMAIANKIDNDLITELGKTTQTVTATGGLTVANLQSAIDIFEDEDATRMVLVCSPADASALRTDAGNAYLGATEVGATAFIKGAYGDVLGAEIHRSRKLDGVAYLVKENALALVMKRDVQVETDRDILKKVTILTADEHIAPYLYDESKVVKIVIPAE